MGGPRRREHRKQSRFIHRPPNAAAGFFVSATYSTYFPPLKDFTSLATWEGRCTPIGRETVKPRVLASQTVPAKFLSPARFRVFARQAAFPREARSLFARVPMNCSSAFSSVTLGTRWVIVRCSIPLFLGLASAWAKEYGSFSKCVSAANSFL